MNVVLHTQKKDILCEKHFETLNIQYSCTDIMCDFTLRINFHKTSWEKSFELSTKLILNFQGTDIFCAPVRDRYFFNTLIVHVMLYIFADENVA